MVEEESLAWQAKWQLQTGASGTEAMLNRLCYNRGFNAIGVAHKRKWSNKECSEIVIFQGCGLPFWRLQWPVAAAPAAMSNQAPLTGLSKRVLVSNSENGTLSFVDAKKDQLNAKVLSAPSATKMLTAGGTTIAMDSAGSEITIIDNATEAVTFNAAIGDQPFDIAISPDGKTAWAAMRNFGFVQSVDTTTGIAQSGHSHWQCTPPGDEPNGHQIARFPGSTGTDCAEYAYVFCGGYSHERRPNHY